MRRSSIIGLCLIAALALSAVLVASASAAEFQECTKTRGGDYTSKECTPGSKVAGTGRYELMAVKTPVALSGKIGTLTYVAYIKGFGIVGAVTCKSGKAKGSIATSKSVTTTLEVDTCTTGGEKCASPGEKAGTIKTEELAGDLVSLTGGEVGVLLAGVGGSTSTFAEFTCGAEKYRWTGSMIGRVSPPPGDGASKEGGNSFEVNAGGEQVISEDEEEPGNVNAMLTEVTGVGTFETGFNYTETIKYKQEIEVVH